MTRLSDKNLLNDPRKALGNFNQAISTGLIEKSTLELVKIRASQMNGCAICLTTHWKVALEIGERVDRLSTVVCWRECDWFSAREKAALAWCEKITNTANGHVTDEDYQSAREQFTQEEIVELTMVIISINSWNKINIAFGTQPMNFEVPGGEPAPATDDGDDENDASNAKDSSEESTTTEGENDTASTSGEEAGSEETTMATDDSETDKAVEYEDNEE